MSQTVSKCLTMGQQVSKGVMCLHIQVRKLSLLGIAVAGVYCCMGLRSVSIERRSCLLLRSEPSIVSFNWQGSLVIRLYSCHCFNQRLIPKKLHCFDRKKRSCPQFLLLHYCPLVIPQSGMNFWIFLFFWDLKGSGPKPNGSTPQIANSEQLKEITFNIFHKIRFKLPRTEYQSARDKVRPTLCPCCLPLLRAVLALGQGTPWPMWLSSPPLTAYQVTPGDQEPV